METSTPIERLWTHAETATYLGLTESSLYQLKDAPPFSKVGKVRRYDPAQVRAWFKARSTAQAA